MTETYEEPQTTVRPVHAEGDRNRLYRALAWVGIAAGSLFIVGSVFFSGYMLGERSDSGPHGPRGPHHMMMRPLPPPDGPIGPGGPMGPGAGRMGPPDAPRS